MSRSKHNSRIRGLGSLSRPRQRVDGGGPSSTSVMVGALAIALAGLALILTVIQALSTDLPQLDQLETYTPRLITKVLGNDDSTVVKEFYTERRVQVPLDSISPYLIQAILATEDQRFYKHWGIDPFGIARAIVVNTVTMSKREGASTLTQQLARNLYLHRRQTYRRKIREMITAVQIERTYAKDEILQMYFTQMYFGHGAYGVQSASKFYFGVSSSDLTLPQAAVLVGLLKAPNLYTPKRHPERAMRRRNTVLYRMLASGYITENEYKSAKKEPITLAESEQDELGVGPYYTEWVRRDLERLQKEHDFDYYKDGLIVHSTMDPQLQTIADSAITVHLTSFQRKFNKRFTKAHKNGLRDWLVDSYTDSLKKQHLIHKEDSTGTVVYDSTIADTLKRFAHYVLHDSLLLDSTSHLASLSLGRLADLIMADTLATDSILKEHFTVQVAFVAMNPYNGDVWAMTGGRDFRLSKYNRAVQAKRQPGSVFKPFVYTTAIDNGIYANYKILNMVQPLKMGDGTWWRPENYNVQNRGEYVSLREGLRRSLNNVTVRMVAGEDRIIPIQEVVKYAHRMGITTRLVAVPAAALGANDVIPLDMVSAYSVFPSGGMHSKPRSIKRIEDRNGQEIVNFPVDREVVLSEETAAIMTDLLQNVVNRGTGGSSRWRWKFYAPAGGKTGTTNNFNNAWFSGFTPKIAAVVWVGFDDHRKSLGYGQSGATAALPIWAIFMREAYKAKGWDFEKFELPVGVVKVPICEESGMKAGPYCPHVYEELFRRGDEPVDVCDEHGAGGNGW